MSHPGTSPAARVGALHAEPAPRTLPCHPRPQGRPSGHRGGVPTLTPLPRSPVRAPFTFRVRRGDKGEVPVGRRIGRGRARRLHPAGLGPRGGAEGRLGPGLGEDQHARVSGRPASREARAGARPETDRRAWPLSCSRRGHTRVLRVASAQAPRRRRPDRTITVTAPPGLAVCNLLAYWLPEGSDWLFLLLNQEINPAPEVTSEVAVPPPCLFK